MNSKQDVFIYFACGLYINGDKKSSACANDAYWVHPENIGNLKIDGGNLFFDGGNDGRF
jgi:hypothetical protein